MDSMSSLSCHCTCSFTVQGAEEPTLHLTASLNARIGCVHKALPSFLNTQRVCTMETNRRLLSWRERGRNQEVGVSIIHCSSQGCYNLANSYVRMIDKTQLIQLCRIGKMNWHQTHQRLCISYPPCGHRPWDGHETFSLCILHMWKLSLIKREPSPTSQFQKRTIHTSSTCADLNKNSVIFKSWWTCQAPPKLGTPSHFFPYILTRFRVFST